MLRPLPCPFLGLAAPFQFVLLLFALLPTSVRVAQGLLCVLAFLLLRLRRSRTPLAFGCVCLLCLSPLCVCLGPFSVCLRVQIVWASLAAASHTPSSPSTPR